MRERATEIHFLRWFYAFVDTDTKIDAMTRNLAPSPVGAPKAEAIRTAQGYTRVPVRK